MTETTGAGGQSSSFVGLWTEALSQVLEQSGGSPVSCQALDQLTSPPAPEGTDLWIVGVCTGALRGELSLRIPAASAARMAQIFMGETPAPFNAITAEHREAVIELMRQVAGLVATQLKNRWGEVQLRLELSDGAPSWPASCMPYIRAGDDSSNASLLEFHLSAALAAAMRTETLDAEKSVAEAVPSDTGNLQMERLMDVELGVTLRFGARRLRLREVLDLNPGAVIELDREVQEPVDVLLDGRIVARGEVVVVDGNYGLRVTEVAPTPIS